ncbi:MAG: hypothetical protein HYZ63_02885 [Candidatus Andersenbacteria bacterium]|nr:hypothetical protein [Candidatus Andersenbacteria bacterium]
MNITMLNGAHTIFMLGIEGSGMRGLAFLLTQRGLTVAGSDDKVTEKRQIHGYTVVPESEAAKALGESDVLVYSDAVKSDHPLRVLAQEQGKRQLAYQEALGEFAKEFQVLAVTGTHGKSSTTAMLAHILIEAGQDTTVLVGASIPQFGGRNARAGKGKYLVVEADEYRRHFLALFPAHVIITSIDFDHPDYFSGLPDVENAYSEFMQQVKAGGAVFAPARVKATHSNLTWPNTTVEVSDEVLTPLPGKHMRENAALAVCLAEKVGVSRQQAINSLQTFEGLSRRMENVGTIKETEVYSDYGHHPHEIQATIAGAREKFDGKKIGVMVEPHMIERLETYFEDFVQALSAADCVLLCPVFYPKGREGGVSTKLDLLGQRLEDMGKPVEKLESYDTLRSALLKMSQKTDVMIAFTAGVLDSKLRKVL